MKVNISKALNSQELTEFMGDIVNVLVSKFNNTELEQILHSLFTMYYPPFHMEFEKKFSDRATPEVNQSLLTLFNAYHLYGTIYQEVPIQLGIEVDDNTQWQDLFYNIVVTFIAKAQSNLKLQGANDALRRENEELKKALKYSQTTLENTDVLLKAANKRLKKSLHTQADPSQLNDSIPVVGNCDKPFKI